MKIPKQELEDREKLFGKLLNAAGEFAKERSQEGKEILPLITGIDREGEAHNFPINHPDNRKQEFYEWVTQKFIDLDIVIGTLMAEAWTVSSKLGSEESKELEKFTKNGGSLEFWPTSTEVFHMEITDGEYFQCVNYKIDRSEDEVNLVKDEEKSKKFCKVEDSGVNGNLLRIFELRKNLL